MPNTKAQALQEKEQTAIAVAAVSFEDDAGGGFEEADRDAYAIPFLRILQKLSPQCDEASGDYLENAKDGMFINSVTDQLYSGKEGLDVVPCHYRRAFVQWNTREQGGGFIAEHDVPTGLKMMESATRDDKNRDILPDGTQLVDTRIHYVEIVDPETGGLSPAVMTLSSTQTKASKRWMTQMQNLLKPRKDGTLYNPAMFASIFTLTTKPEKNDQGSWHSFKIVHKRFLNEADQADQITYQTARAFRDAIKSGEAEVRHDIDAPEGAAVVVPSDDVPPPADEKDYGGF